jgi:hypothetical protein
MVLEADRTTPAILDHARTLARRDGHPRPAFTGGAEGGECDLIVLDARDMLHDAFAIGGPSIDAEGEVILVVVISVVLYPNLPRLRASPPVHGSSTRHRSDYGIHPQWRSFEYWMAGGGRSR